MRRIQSRIFVGLVLLVMLLLLIRESQASFSFFKRGGESVEDRKNSGRQATGEGESTQSPQSPEATTAGGGSVESPPIETGEIESPPIEETETSPHEQSPVPSPPPPETPTETAATPSPSPPQTGEQSGQESNTSASSGPSPPPAAPNQFKILECPMRCPTVRNVRKRQQGAGEEPQLLCCGDQCYDPKTQRCCRGQGHAVFPWEGSPNTPPDQLKPSPPQRQIGAATVCPIESGCCLEKCYKHDVEFCFPLVMDKNATCNL